MRQDKGVFRFKQFACAHSRSSMKIGVDAVLLGAWADVGNATRILDVGTGCGVIALMCAQRNPDAHIDAIDIDAGSVEEASSNFMSSPWADRLKASLEDYNDISLNKYDLIISNPPYFKSGIDMPETSRLVARHESGLSPARLLDHARDFLLPGGAVNMVIPSDRFEELMYCVAEYGYRLSRGCRVKGHPDAPVKRLLLEFERCETAGDRNESRQHVKAGEFSWENLTLETSPGHPTEAHRMLCKEFYLKF